MAGLEVGHYPIISAYLFTEEIPRHRIPPKESQDTVGKRDNKYCGIHIEGKVMKLIIAGLLFWITETGYFGWNWSPSCDAERVCDAIALCIVVLGLYRYGRAQLKKQNAELSDVNKILIGVIQTQNQTINQLHQDLKVEGLALKAQREAMEAVRTELRKKAKEKE